MGMELKIISPNGVVGPLECDSVHLFIADDAQEKMGGSYGIRQGHAEAVLVLDRGELSAFFESKLLLQGIHSSGFATVEKNLVTVVAENFEEKSI